MELTEAQYLGVQLAYHKQWILTHLWLVFAFYVHYQQSYLISPHDIYGVQTITSLIHCKQSNPRPFLQ